MYENSENRCLGCLLVISFLCFSSSQGGIKHINMFATKKLHVNHQSINESMHAYPLCLRSILRFNDGLSHVNKIILERQSGKPTS